MERDLLSKVGRNVGRTLEAALNKSDPLSKLGRYEGPPDEAERQKARGFDAGELSAAFVLSCLGLVRSDTNGHP